VYPVVEHSWVASMRRKGIAPFDWLAERRGMASSSSVPWTLSFRSGSSAGLSNCVVRQPFPRIRGLAAGGGGGGCCLRVNYEGRACTSLPNLTFNSVHRTRSVQDGRGAD